MAKKVEAVHEVSQYEIAKRLGISRERVGFLERQALRKLRKGLEARGMTVEDFVELVREGKGAMLALDSNRARVTNRE